MDESAKLRLALVASRHAGAGLAARARQLGVAAFDGLLSEVPGSELARAEDEASELAARGVSAALLGSPEYPRLLRHVRGAPPCLFYLGARDLLSARGIGVCGSRNATDEGLRAAAACAEVATHQGLAVISGYARGVDAATHTSALASGGRTIMVLPEGISHFRVKRGPIGNAWDPARALVVSQFPPSRPWSAGTAMARNSVIIGLSLGLIVVEAGAKGGTLAAGSRALQMNRQVLALEFGQNPPGNAELIRHGAIPVQNRAELCMRLAQMTDAPEGNQLSMI